MENQSLTASGRIVVAIPMYNEQAVVNSVVRDVLTVFGPPTPEVHLVVVDDGSTDGTRKVLSEWPGITVMQHEKRLGIGATLCSALDYCSCVGADYLVWHVGNGRIPAKCVAGMLDAAIETNSDYVVGSRFAKGGRALGTPLLRMMAMKVGNAFLKCLCRECPSDVTCGVRVIRLSVWNQDWNREIKQTRYASEQLMTIRMIENRAKIAESSVEIHYLPNRMYSHFQWRDTAQVLSPWIKFFMRYRKPKE